MPADQRPDLSVHFCFELFHRDWGYVDDAVLIDNPQKHPGFSRGADLLLGGVDQKTGISQGAVYHADVPLQHFPAVSEEDDIIGIPGVENIGVVKMPVQMGKI